MNPFMYLSFQLHPCILLIFINSNLFRNQRIPKKKGKEKKSKYHNALALTSSVHYPRNYPDF